MELLSHLPEELQFYTGATSVVDAQICLQAWSNLDDLPHFWDDWEATPDGEQLVPHFRAISQVARYALQHNAVMLQIIT